MIRKIGNITLLTNVTTATWRSLAKREGRPVRDEEAQTACSSSCSTNALVFGDSNNKESEVWKLRNDERAYDLLDHLNVNPSVFYQTKIRNKS